MEFPKTPGCKSVSSKPHRFKTDTLAAWKTLPVKFSIKEEEEAWKRRHLPRLYMHFYYLCGNKGSLQGSKIIFLWRLGEKKCAQSWSIEVLQKWRKQLLKRGANEAEYDVTLHCMNDTKEERVLFPETGTRQSYLSPINKKKQCYFKIESSAVSCARIEQQKFMKPENYILCKVHLNCLITCVVILK